VLPALALGRAVGDGDGGGEGLAGGAVLGRGVVVVAGAVVAGATEGEGEMRTVSVGVQDVATRRLSANSPVARRGEAFILSVLTLIGL
jgi:hypothetical protein